MMTWGGAFSGLVFGGAFFLTTFRSKPQWGQTSRPDLMVWPHPGQVTVLEMVDSTTGVVFTGSPQYLQVVESAEMDRPQDGHSICPMNDPRPERYAFYSPPMLRLRLAALSVLTKFSGLATFAIEATPNSPSLVINRRLPLFTLV